MTPPLDLYDTVFFGWVLGMITACVILLLIPRR